MVPQALLEQPVDLRRGIGAVHDKVSTSSADAQAFYDQGLAYLHSFVWIEAARSFHQALRLDSALAMAHIGLSYAYVEVNKPDAARQALARARALSSAASAHDRQHIELRELQVAAEDAPRDASKLPAYRQALDRALAEFPSDVELVLLRGLAESFDPADRGQGTAMSSVPYFVRALERAPEHFAAHHYLTHAYENAGRAADALEHGRTYARLAPEVPHARHMHGHNLRRVGRVDEAIAEFEAADGLQRQYFARERVAAEHDWHHHHNVDLLASSYRYVGRMREAETTFRTAFTLPSNLLAQLFNKRLWPGFLLSRGRTSEAADAAIILIAHPHSLIRATGHIELGFGQVAAGRISDAIREANTALNLLRSGPEGAPMAATPLLVLQGEIALRAGQRAKGRQHLEEAARRARAAAGPDSWSEALFALEAIARAARAVGDRDLVRWAAQQMHEHDARYAGTHYFLALAAEDDGDVEGAIREFEQAARAWHRADADLPELAEVKARLARLRPR